MGDGRFKEMSMKARAAGVRRLLCVVVAACAVCSVAACGAGKGVEKTGPKGDAGDSGAPYGARTSYMDYQDDVRLNAVYMGKLRDDLRSWKVNDMDYLEEILKDSVITADEMNDLERKANGCFEKYGYTMGKNLWFSVNGGTEVDNHGNYAEAERQCGYANGYLIVQEYYTDAYRNPNSVDLEPYRFQCYKDYGLIAQDYSYEKFEQGLDKGESPLSGLTPGTKPHDDFLHCTDDPLHYMKSKH